MPKVSGVEARIEARLKKGHGQGTGPNYVPWVDVRRFSSRGSSNRIWSSKSGRLIHLLSNRELRCYFLLEWNDQIVDIREQFPLLPLSETRQIAASRGYRHPQERIRENGQVVTEDREMTSDFRVTFHAGAEIPEMVISVKPTNALRDPQTYLRTLEKLEIERQYWTRQGIPWRIATDEQLPEPLVTNLALLLPYRSLDGRGIPENDVPGMLSFLYSTLRGSPDVPLGRICTATDQRLGLRRGDSISLIWYAIATKRWRVDMNVKLAPTRPLLQLEAEADHG